MRKKYFFILPLVLLVVLQIYSWDDRYKYDMSKAPELLIVHHSLFGWNDERIITRESMRHVCVDRTQRNSIGSSVEPPYYLRIELIPQNYVLVSKAIQFQHIASSEAQKLANLYNLKMGDCILI